MPRGLEIVHSVSSVEAAAIVPDCREENTQEPDTRALFLDGSNQIEQMPGNEKARLFPVDDLGIPLSIYIPRRYRNRNGKGNLAKDRFPTNRHHRFGPEKSLLHDQGILGKIMRHSCIQIVPVELHDQFNRFYTKPYLPEAREWRFGAALLSAARYLPPEAIDCRGNVPLRRELSLYQRQRIWANNEIRPAQGSKLQEIMLDYIIEQDLTGAEDLIDVFVNTQDGNVRIKTGKELFNIAAEVAVGPFHQKYINAWESALLPRQDIRNEHESRPFSITQPRAAPRSPRLFVVRHLGHENSINNCINKMHSNYQDRKAA